MYKPLLHKTSECNLYIKSFHIYKAVVKSPFMHYKKSIWTISRRSWLMPSRESLPADNDDDDVDSNNKNHSNASIFVNETEEGKLRNADGWRK